MTKVDIHSVRRGRGAPLLLVHGLGGTWEIWGRVLDQLAEHREVVAIDLPGFGRSPGLAGDVSVPAYARALARFIEDSGLAGADVMGVSFGARLLLDPVVFAEVGRVVALSPGGMWQPGSRRLPANFLKLQIKAVRNLQPLMPALASQAAGRILLSAQLSAAPWRLPSDVVLHQMRSLSVATSTNGVIDAMVHSPLLEPVTGPDDGKLTIGWGRQDRMTPPKQAALAKEIFPSARFHWFDRCGHCPHWDQPDEVVGLALSATERT